MFGFTLLTFEGQGNIGESCKWKKNIKLVKDTKGKTGNGKLIWNALYSN